MREIGAVIWGFVGPPGLEMPRVPSRGVTQLAPWGQFIQKSRKKNSIDTEFISLAKIAVVSR